MLKALWKDPSSRFALVALAMYAAAALFGEVQYRNARFRQTVPEYNRIEETRRYEPPSLSAGGFILGSDNLGRSVALRLLQGTRIAFHVGVVTSLIAIPLGAALGLAGGYFGGKTDAFAVWLCATVYSVPSLLLILAIAMVAGKGLGGIYWGIGLTTWVSVFRTVRAETIKIRKRPFIQAIEVLGYPSWRILLRHVLPNVMHIILVSLSIRFPAAVGTEVFVSFLGIGVQGEPSWGIMLNNSRMRLWQGVWWEIAFVSLAIFLLVLSFNILADKMRDVNERG